MLEYLGFKFMLFLARITPFSVIYIFSDFLYFLLFHIIGYRKNVVYSNLRLAFPNKNEEQINQIAKKFYHYLADMFVETPKFFTLSEQEIKKRLHIINPEHMNSYYDQGKSIIVAGSHVGNWEIGAIGAPFWFKHLFIVLYKKIKNPRLDQLIKKLRSKYGTKMVPITLTARSFLVGSKPYSVIMLSDQNPPNPDKAIWVNFFGQPTATLHGLELYAKKFNLPVLYFDMSRVKRGYYSVRLETLIEQPRQMQKGQITYVYMKRVEKAIKHKPHLWLWSHRRWKHKFNPQKYKVYQFD